MPIYEFTCQDCGSTFETLVMKNDEPTCKSCGSTKVSRLMSACGFVSKGIGAAPGTTETVKTSAGTSACSGCTATSCSSCGA
ncbi:MAG: FmdB family transcriptional regulator [Deltaproteobacteria bacterium]|nr:MAG: FmdB family transcriptional regulator [Deltaproteobacteria bacterium]